MFGTIYNKKPDYLLRYDSQEKYKKQNSNTNIMWYLYNNNTYFLICTLIFDYYL